MKVIDQTSGFYWMNNIREIVQQPDFTGILKMSRARAKKSGWDQMRKGTKIEE
jgi:hypothetical protein